MRILVHDYSGHPFQVQLSRALARRGHDVLHVHCSSYATGKGAVDEGSDDPDGLRVVLSSNDPLFAKARAARWCRRTRTPWVFWLQDIYSHAMSAYARSRLGVAGAPVGAVFHAIERRLLREASGVVAITDDFRP